MPIRSPAQQRAPWVVLPFRGVGQGKSRLAAALGASERARFNRWLLVHTLRVVAAWQGGLARCIVVSGCARTLRIARRLGATALPEAYPHGDLNCVLTRAVRKVRLLGARRILVLSCDLPRLSAAALDSLVDTASMPAHVVLATDHSNTGTNALLLNTRGRFTFGFGADSRMRHVQAARRNGWTINVINRRELALDIDTPRDLADWEHSPPMVYSVTQQIAR